MSLNDKYLHKTSADTLSVVSRTTSDYFPQSYKRPAPYLLWDDNIVPINFPNSPTFSCCRLFLGILITVAVLGVIVVISIAVYLGVITSTLMEEANNEQSFDGRLKVTRGDDYNFELEDPSSLEFQLKAKKYETMINMLLKESSLKDGYKETEVTGFRSGSLIVFFRVNLDRRKVPLKPRDLANTIQNVIALDAGSKQPRVLKDLSIDLTSLSVWDSYTKKKSTPVAKVKSSPVMMVTETNHVTSSSVNLPRNSTAQPLIEVGKAINASQMNVTLEETKSVLTNDSHQTTTNWSKTFPTTSVTKLQSSSELNSNAVTNVTPVTEIKQAKQTVVSAATEASQGLVHGSWTPLTRNPFKLPEVMGNTISVTASSSPLPLIPSGIPNRRKVNPEPNKVTNGGTLPSNSQPLRRAEALTSGIAHEIQFSLDDLSFHDHGSHQDTAASVPLSSSVRMPNYSMEANVATLLLLKPPISERNGDVSSRSTADKTDNRDGEEPITTPQSGRQTVFRPFQSYHPFDGQSGSKSYMDGVEVRISSAPVRKDLSSPVAEMHATAKLDWGQGRPDFRETTKNASSGSLREDSAKSIDTSERPGLVAQTSRTRSSLPSSYGELNVQSGGILLKEPKKFYLSGSINRHDLFDDLMNHDWVTVPLRRHTVISRSTTPAAGSKHTNVPIDGSESQSASTTSTKLMTMTTISSNKEKAINSDDQSDPLLAEELIIEPTSVPRPHSSLILGETWPAYGDNANGADTGGVRQNASCLSGMFVCSNANLCISMSKVCDSHLDCPQGEDEKYCECGTRPMVSSPRIVGGSNAVVGSWPWQAAMYKSGEYMCGASLINDRWLISAAHCFYNEVNNHWTARLGMLQRGSQAPYEQIQQISHIIIHPNYVKVGFINDVTLLRMQNSVAYSDYIRPTCLPSLTQDGVYNGRMCTVVGWGQLMETGHVFPDTLQEVDLPIYTPKECRKKTFFLQTYQITENMFCAGYDRGGRDACLGDSGGPLVCQESDGRWSLIGITSNGFGCARAWRPGIYTKVANYVSWINQVMTSPLRNPVRTYCRGHRCQLGQCLPTSSICDGFKECLDGSDEQRCS